jgi:DNA-binding transcriptional LysR family regulator
MDVHLMISDPLKYIEQFRNDYPGIDIKILSLSTGDLIKELQQHKLDFIIDSSPIESIYNNMIIKPFNSFDTCFICSNDSEIDLTNIKNLENYNLILPLERSSVRRNLERELKNYDIALTPILEVETTNLIISSVKRNIGVGYVIKETVREELNNNNIKEAKVTCKLPRVELNLIYIDNYLTNTSKKFIDNYIKM